MPKCTMVMAIALLQGAAALPSPAPRAAAAGLGLWQHDWPQFGKSPAFLSYNDVTTAPKHKEWTWRSKNKLVASPAVAAGRVILGSDDGYVYALNQSSGEQLWAFKTAMKGELGVRSSPAIHADLSISFGSYDGHVYHIDQYGKLLWKYYTGEQIYCPASVDEDGTIYIGNYRPSNCLYALHPDKRPFGQQLKWKVCGEKNGAFNSGPAFAPGGDTVVMNNFDGQIRGIDKATGKLKWSLKTGAAQSGGASAVVVGGTAFIGSWDKHFYALDIASGKVLWRFDTQGEVESHAAYEGGVVYLTSEESKAAFALNATTGAVLWQRNNLAAQEINGSPSLTKEHVFFGANDGVLYALERATGKTAFTFQACPQHIFSSAAVADNGMLYFTCGDDSETPSVAPNTAFALDPALHL